jgi:hypothetical protein
MAGTVKHNDLTPLFGLTEWIAEHNFAGGATGALLHRDSGQTDGANWLAAVATGSVLISSGVGAAPAWSAAPALTSLAIGTSVPATPPGLIINNANGLGLVLRPGSTSGSRTPFIIRDPSTTQVWTFFDTTGALNTVAYIRINGNQSATLSDAGAFNISSASGSAISCMLDVVSDVDGPTVVWAANTGGSAYHLQCLDSSVIASAKYVFSILKDGTLSWGAGANHAAEDTTLTRAAAAVLAVTSAFQFPERSDPTAPSTNNAILYAKDNGSGKTQIVVRFPTGAVQVLATEP